MKGAKSILDGISISLPAVTRSLKLQKRAAKEGFDWKKPEDTLKKVKEELNELTFEMKNQLNLKKEIMNQEYRMFCSVLQIVPVKNFHLILYQC